MRIDGIAPKQNTPFAMTLAPHETRVLDAARDITGSYGGTLKNMGGITVEHSSPAGSLLARVLVEDAAAGYSSSLRFYDPRKAKSTKLQGAGLRIGQVGGERLTPIVVARNVGSDVTFISGRIPYATEDGQTGAINLPTLQLAPGETKMFDMRAALRRSGVEQRIATAGLEFEYTGDPGGIIMTAQSLSRNGDHAFLVPMWDILAQRSSTGGYPWSIEGDSSTVVYIKNVTDSPQRYTLQLNFAGGVYSLGLKSVEAGQTVALDIRNLRDNQVPDTRGRTIPMEATHGQVHWSSNGEGNLKLIGRAEQVDIVRGMSSSYACANCCPNGFYTGWLDPGSVQGFVGDTTQFNAFQQDMTCYGNLLEPFDPFPSSWGSTDYSVADCIGGLAMAQAPGSTSFQARWTVYELAETGGYYSCETSPRDFLAEAICDVLGSAIRFKTAKYWTDATSNFTDILGRYTTTLNIGASSRGGLACGGSEFAITLDFDFPPGHGGLVEPPFTFVKSEGQYRLVSWEIYDKTSTGGKMSIVLKRTGEGTDNKVRVTITGYYDSGGRYQGLATVNLTCPN